ncbi:hypothetical protein M441DRAFT_238565 [Trichoderma asperellum CBS 433.97]|uniref:Uncharacterized protein n=1 Tax=Trichoderma asperellum (strain ATCC 204424 / CBS 433.97 / NBRC 101777) TaxID=1042311 RepID=A0A2T3Z1T0_TRIA4|nr:hypothetical protein M441DRAFT_238565 [Trichoderma asperellum CBS 433.97]PTB38771.1 hypothetical protein M441DRAFT_238565 [Trichoderma asperellum CBS 433.97]
MAVSLPHAEIFFQGANTKDNTRANHCATSSNSSGANLYLVSDPNPRANRNISSSESEILFGNRLDRGAEQLNFMHNDLQPSNIIDQNDVSAVHSQFLTPRREDFAGVQLSEEKMDDLEHWVGGGGRSLRL